MQKYVCTGCYSVYDPLIGDPESGIEPGTDFDEITEEYRCGVCMAPKEMFLLLPENIQEALDPDNLLNKESEHVPRYCEKDGYVFVRLWEWEEDIDFPASEDHRLTSVGLFDESGEPIEWKIIDPENPLAWYRFEKPDDDYEVRAGCNLHGTWKGIFDTTIVDDIPKNIEQDA